MDIVRAFKVFFNIKTKGDLIVFIAVIVMFNVYVGGGAAYMAWTEWQLQQELAQRGVLTQATVVDCIRSRNSTSIWFEFEAPGRNGEIERYKVEGGFSGWGCTEGDLIRIKYLAENPNRAAKPGPAQYRMLMILSCLGFAIPWVLGSIDFLKRKHKGEI